MHYAQIEVALKSHPRALLVGPVARDLWLWGMLYAYEHETDGVIDRVCVMTSQWGANGKGNLKIAERLVEVGLWIQTETGWVIHNFTKKNPTKAAVETKRAEARERMKSRRSSQPVRANTLRTESELHAQLPNCSTSTSSEIGMDPDPTRESDSSDPVTLEAVKPLVDNPPTWRADVVSMLAMSDPRRAPKADEVGPMWLDFLIQRAKVHRPATREDWANWIRNAPKFAPRQPSSGSRFGKPEPATVRVEEYKPPRRDAGSGMAPLSVEIPALKGTT